jgi:hypothetical protein
MIQAVQVTQDLDSPEAMGIALGETQLRTAKGPDKTDVRVDEIESLHIGQGFDLHWTRHASCPSQEEYLEMVSKSMWHVRPPTRDGTLTEV